jgi:Phospholipase_D-nuclease N-terminal
MFGSIASAAFFIFIIFVLVDIITKENWQIKNLPKVTWVFIVIFLPLIGAILWFALGREWDSPKETISFGDPRRRENSTAPAERTDLENIDLEIAFHEKQARIRRLEAEIAERQNRKPGNSTT